MKKHNKYILFVLLIWICNLEAWTNTINFQHLPLEATATQITINGLYQDEFGVLWIGTKDGVKRYDGNNIKSIDLMGTNNWIQSNLVPTVCGDKNGHLFINTDYDIIEYNLLKEESRNIFSQPDIKTLPSIAFSYGLNSLWIGLFDSIYNYKEGECLFRYKLGNDDIKISSIKEASSKKLYIGTKNNGVFCINSMGLQYKILNIQSEIISISEDSKHNIWIGTFSDGLFKISTSDEITHYTAPQLASNYVRAVCEDNNGDIWIGTMLGLNVINAKTGAINYYGLEEKGKSGLSNLSVWIIMKDDQGTMWFGTYYGGLDYYNPHTNIFEYSNLGMTLYGGGPVISKIVEDKTGVFWIGTEGNGLVAYNPQTANYKYYTKEQNTISHNNIKTLYYDEQSDVVWIGTHLGGLCSYSINTKKFKHYTIDRSDNTKRSEIVQAIIRQDNILYLGTLSGVYHMNLNDNSINKTRILDRYIHTVNTFMIDDDGNLWIGGNNLCCYQPRQDLVRSFDKHLFKITTSTKNTITSIIQDKNKHIIASTLGSGIFILNPENEEFKQIDSGNSNVGSDYFGAIYALDNGYLLAANAFGLSCIDLEQRKSYNYNSQNKFVLRSMIPGDIIKDQRNNIVMGGVNGMAIVTEKDLFSENLPTKIFFSKLTINNKEVVARDSSNILFQSLLVTEHIKLKHNQNNISIEVGNNNFINFGQPRYQYKLDGYDDEWIDLLPRKSINYMNLPYGDYKLRVRNMLYENQDDFNEIRMSITIISPIYARWYAYLAYVFLALSVVVSIAYFYHSKLMLRNSLELERREKYQKDMINESKMRFLGNMSHELKTPITLISGQLELMLMSNNIIPSVRNNLREIHNRATKMGQLINELLDMLKYNKNDFKLKVRKHNIILFSQEIYDSFSSYARLKNIDFQLVFEQKEQCLWFDKEQMQKVYNNLLSNAFRFTPEGGKVEIVINNKDESIEMEFRDSGIGIPKNMTNQIFERFFQVSNSINNDLYNTGTGIGLSLVSSIIKAHQGDISVVSEEGRGSSFILKLPKGNKHFKANDSIELEDSEYSSPFIDVLDIEGESEDLDEFIELQKEKFGNQSTLLIVEDNDDLRNLLIQIFEPLFQIYEATNGEDAFEIAQLNSPDLILSDVLMPGISGINLCAKIKSDFSTSHIPFILLTALSSIEHNIQGLNCGADDYITKPFNIRILVSKCINLLNNRRRLQELYRKQDDDNVPQITTNSIDQDFIDQVVKIIQENIESKNVDISFLCVKLAMSRTKLFLKLKGITGQTPHDFILNVKMKTAAKMLRENLDYNISDVAYQLGFSSLNYFGKSFKDYFGVSPSAYRKNRSQRDTEK